ncbi:TVP38/TMEM64 family protein [Maricaulis sp.]|uniref:TVP38/TMEM64 family protein n=1 Tax=Maricaulis sp. TaxID=1486257 RepID=UPI003A91B443
MEDPALTNSPTAGGRVRLRLAAGLVLASAMLLALWLGASPQALVDLAQGNGDAGWIGDNLLLASLAYALFYVLAVTVSLPGALWFSIGAGFLLGAPAAIPVSLAGITLGAANAWLILRFLAGPGLRQRTKDRIARFADGFHRNEFAYVILLRVLPLPFFLVNLAAALLGHRFVAFFAGTLIGSLPSVVLYANLGAGLGELVEAGVQPGLSDLTRPSFLIAVAMVVLMGAVAIGHRLRVRARARDALSRSEP